MAMTAYLQKKLGDHATAQAAFTMPSAVYLALFSASPGENSSLTAEFSGGSYARVLLTSKMGAFDAVTGLASNTSVAIFPAPTASWGSLVYAGICDAPTGGNTFFYMPVGNPRVINNGDPAPSFAVGTLTIGMLGTLQGMITSYLAKKLGDHAIGKSAYTMPAGVFLGLSASDPGVSGAQGGEVGVGGYARQALAGYLGPFDASSGVATNVAGVAFPTPSVDYPSVAYSFVADGPSAGNILFSGQLPAALVLKSGGSGANFPAGSINLTVA